MRTILGVAGAAIILTTFAIRVPAQVCPDVTGCWTGSYSGDISGTTDLAFQQTGDELAGRQKIVDSTIGTFSGSVVGSAECAFVQFTTTLDEPFSAVTLNSSAEVTGNCMAGTFFVPSFNFNATWQACRVDCCGNGVIQLDETCDDGNASAGDGCSATCAIESGFTCSGQPSVCIPIVCGNGVVQPGEQCDDGDTSGGDGCSATCAIESGFTCSGQPSVCIPIVCGNGVVQPGEECDDGNTATGDCCRPDCTVDPAGTGCEAPVPFPGGTCDGNGNCVGIPTLSEWGVVALSLLMLGAVLRDRRRGMAPERR